VCRDRLATVRRHLVFALALALLGPWLGACGEPPPGAEARGLAHDGPILLITLDGLRFDAVGAFGGGKGLTPNLDGLIREADWAGPAVASSSELVPAMASLFTGLKPWQHQVLGRGEAGLGEPGLGAPPRTLPEALAELGYTGHAYNDDRSLSPARGYGRGFEEIQTVRRGGKVTADLAAVPPGRNLYWVHLSLPAPPYSRRARFLPRLGPLPEGTPEVVRGVDLEPYFDPAVPLPAAERERLWALYRHNVAAADGMVGRLLRALAQSGQSSRTLVAVVSSHGQEFGEHDQVSSGGNLGRALVEVPMILRLPDGFARPLAVSAESRPPASRLWATLVEAAGGRPPPGVAASLFRAVDVPALSELYAAGPKNEVSLVEGGYQLRWIVPLPIARRIDSRTWYEVRRAAAASPRGSQERRVVRQVTAALIGSFRTALPLHTGMAPELRLERWGEEGVERVLDEPERVRQMTGRLLAAWSLFVGPEYDALRQQPVPEP